MGGVKRLRLPPVCGTFVVFVKQREKSRIHVSDADIRPLPPGAKTCLRRAASMSRNARQAAIEEMWGYHEGHEEHEDGRKSLEGGWEPFLPGLIFLVTSRLRVRVV